MSSVVTVEAVQGRVARRRFVELPYVLFRGEPRWARPLVAYERWRLDGNRNPAYEGGETEWWLARVAGRVSGRLLAWAPHGGGEGRFGFFDVVDDGEAAAALIAAAAGWLRTHVCSAMVGPVAFNGTDEGGVLVGGYDAGGTTGREWHPPWYAHHLVAAGLESLHERPTWRLVSRDVDDTHDVLRPGGGIPPQAGGYGDPALVRVGDIGEIAAVPDVSGPAASGRSAWSLAHQARRRQWDGCTVVRLKGAAERLVPGLVAAAVETGYEWVVAPWAPDDRPFEATHRVYRLGL
ncbi:MAG: hypothetical protein ACRD29_18450 [Acidimicrobiales bacterium]